MLHRYFFKALQMLARRLRIALALKSARDTEFRRGVIGKRGERFLKFGDGFVVTLKLRVKVAEKIMGVSFGGELRDVLKCFDCLFRFARIFVDQAKVIPGVRIIRQQARCFFEREASGYELLLAEQRDAQVQASNSKFWVGGKRLLEIFLSFREFLLVHVRNA